MSWNCGSHENETENTHALFDYVLKPVCPNNQSSVRRLVEPSKVCLVFADNFQRTATADRVELFLGCCDVHLYIWYEARYFPLSIEQLLRVTHLCVVFLHLRHVCWIGKHCFCGLYQVVKTCVAPESLPELCCRLVLCCDKIFGIP